MTKYKKRLSRGLLVTALCLPISLLAYGQAGDITQTREPAHSLARAKTPEERIRLLTSHRELVTVALRRAVIIEGNTLLAEGRYSEARAVYDTAKSISEQIGDKAGVGSALLNTGTVLYLQGSHEQAVESYDAARRIFLEAKERAELARALMGIGFVRKEQGRSSEALEFLQQSHREFEASGPSANAEELTEVLNAIGSIYQSQGDHSAALKIFERSLARNDNSQSALRIGKCTLFSRQHPSGIGIFCEGLEATRE